MTIGAGKRAGRPRCQHPPSSRTNARCVSTIGRTARRVHETHLRGVLEADEVECGSLVAAFACGDLRESLGHLVEQIWLAIDADGKPRVGTATLKRLLEAA